ncbi:hypothetical protein ACWD46_19970 [Streptomyces sp. NPDC002486]
MSGNVVTDWHLGHVVRNAENKMTAWNIGEPISAEEVQKHKDHAAILHEAIPGSPYAHLQERHTAFMEAASKLLDPGMDSQRTKQIADSLPLLVDGILSSLRAFDDRTAHSLSRRYGKGSPEVEKFKQSLSFEYDNEFAYRFMYKLRNYSQHCGVPELSGNARGYLSENGERRKEVSVTFDSVKLLGQYDGWGAQVKRELQAIQGQFDAIETLNRMMLSCSRIYAQLLISRADELKEAADYIAGLDRSPEGVYSVPAFFGLNRAEWQNPGGSRNPVLNFVRVDLVRLLEESLKDAAVVLEHPRMGGHPPTGD